MKGILLSTCSTATACLGSAYPILLQSTRLPDFLVGTDHTGLSATWILSLIIIAIITFVLTRQYEKRRYLSRASATQLQQLHQQQKNTEVQLPLEGNRHLASVYRELIQANQDIEIFLYKAYHNFLGPIATIRGICNVAAMESREVSSLDYFEKVSTVADNMQDMLAQLLEISVIHDRELVIESIDLEQFLEKVRVDLLVNTAYSAIRIRHQFSVPVQLEIDSFLLQQTIVKIISNTFPFRRQGTRSQLDLAVAYQEEGEDHYLILRDDHLSIPDEIASDIFRMFYRGTQQADDHGLGLYTARYALRRMGGDILMTTRGYSTTFRLRLPRRTNQQYQHFLETLADYA